ncbi:MAG: metalloregulator ArsR/SmtB family transcription factor [Nocardioides sp.]
MSWEVGSEDRIVELRAFAHPVRLRMLSLLRGREASATQLAGELEIATGSASYHLRTLAKSGLIEVAAERMRRGGIERFYRLAHPVSQLRFGEQDRREFAESALSEARRKLGQADLADLSTVGDAELWLDPRDWSELVEREKQLMADLVRRGRPRGTAGTVAVSMTVLWFALQQEAPDGTEPE